MTAELSISEITEEHDFMLRYTLYQENERLKRENAAYVAQFAAIGIVPYLQRMQELADKLANAKTAIRHALEKVVSEHAGLTNNEFAYLWTKDWQEFKRLAKEAGCEK